MTSDNNDRLTVVFDLDGTLVDTAPDLVAATNHVLARQGLAPIALETLKVWVGSGAREMIVQGLKHANVTLPETDIDHLLGEFLIHYEANIANASRSFPGAVRALERLSADGCTLAICTNKREALSVKLLDALDLTRHFAAIAGRDTFPVSKPDPGHLIGTIQMAGGSARHAILVGDSATDIQTGRAANIPVIAVTHGYSERPIRCHQPDAVIEHFRDLEAAIRQTVAL